MMMTATSCLEYAGAACSLLLAALPCTADDFFLRDGDTVVMMGDSITAQRLYSSYVEAWSLTRFPTWDLRFFNVGIGGDGAPGGNSRFQRDVLPYAATTMTVDFGMNDAGGDYGDFIAGIQGIADQVGPGAGVGWRGVPP